MIVAMQDQATEENIQQGIERMVGLGFKGNRTTGAAQPMRAGVRRVLWGGGKEAGLLGISGVMEISEIELMLPYIDCFQVGARNMQNFNLLRELGHVRKPVLLKRGISATIEEVLLSAEYILSGGNYDLMLCERGIRTYETYTRNTMDISAIPVLKKL